MTLFNFIVLNIVIAVVIFLLKVRRQRYQAVCEFLLILLLPGVGVMFLAISHLLNSKDDEQDLSYVYQDFKREQKVLRNVLKNEGNIIPVSDVLLLDNIKTKRTMLGDVIKRDVLHSRDILFEAVGHADSEISHYAVAVITNRLAELEVLLYTIRKKSLKEPDNLKIWRQYADAMYSYLEISNLDKISWQKYEQEYIMVLEKLTFLDSKEKKYFCELITCYLRAENFKKGEDVCRNFQEKFPLAEEPYLQFIHLYYYEGNQEALMNKINELKQANIKITNQALDMIRFWDGGISYAS